MCLTMGDGMLNPSFGRDPSKTRNSRSPSSFSAKETSKNTQVLAPFMFLRKHHPYQGRRGPQITRSAGVACVKIGHGTPKKWIPLWLLLQATPTKLASTCLSRKNKSYVQFRAHGGERKFRLRAVAQLLAQLAEPEKARWRG